jgi:hypothetical protein
MRTLVGAMSSGGHQRAGLGDPVRSSAGTCASRHIGPRAHPLIGTGIMSRGGIGTPDLAIALRSSAKTHVCRGASVRVHIRSLEHARMYSGASTATDARVFRLKVPSGSARRALHPNPPRMSPTRSGSSYAHWLSACSQSRRKTCVPRRGTFGRVHIQSLAQARTEIANGK